MRMRMGLIDTDIGMPEPMIPVAHLPQTTPLEWELPFPHHDDLCRW